MSEAGLGAAKELTERWPAGVGANVTRHRHLLVDFLKAEVLRLNISRLGNALQRLQASLKLGDVPWAGGPHLDRKIAQPGGQAKILRGRRRHPLHDDDDRSVLGDPPVAEREAIADCQQVAATLESLAHLADRRLDRGRSGRRNRRRFAGCGDTDRRPRHCTECRRAEAHTDLQRNRPRGHAASQHGRCRDEHGRPCRLDPSRLRGRPPRAENLLELARDVADRYPAIFSEEDSGEVQSQHVPRGQVHDRRPRVPTQGRAVVHQQVVVQADHLPWREPLDIVLISKEPIHQFLFGDAAVGRRVADGCHILHGLGRLVGRMQLRR